MQFGLKKMGKTSNRQIKKDKTEVQFLRLGTLGSPIEFKHIVTLNNKTQTMLSFPRIFKFNIFKFN
jgi:hypothetical protein